VLIIDEIHERSANIDILLLLLNQYYKVSKRKLKLVLCSATIDKNIGKILQDANLKIGTFEVKVQRHPITEVPIKTGNILGRIL
jgi:HrpA-like RNA helicase